LPSDTAAAVVVGMAVEAAGTAVGEATTTAVAEATTTAVGEVEALSSCAVGQPVISAVAE